MQMMNQLEQSQNTVLKNSVNGIGKRFAGRIETDDSGNSASKKCRVLSMAMEQQCLQTEYRPKTLFKRDVDYKQTQPNDRLKKFFAKIKAIAKHH